jgi:RND family efflux transporter MFP subunit
MTTGKLISIWGKAMAHKIRRIFQRIQLIKFCTLLLFSLFLPADCGKKLQPPPPPKVTVDRPVRREVTDYLELTGNTQAVNTVQLVARVAGYLDKVFFRDGQMVRKGQLLFLIQQDTYIAGLQQAEGQVLALKSQLEYAQSQLVRYTNLLPQKAAAQTDVDNWRYQRDSAQANLKAAEANRDLARLNLDYTQVTSPFDGRIDRRLQDPGNFVGSGGNTVLAQINQIDPIYVYFTISDIDLARLLESTHGLPGQGRTKKWPVFVGLVNEADYPHQGRLDFAAISLSTTTGTLLLRGILSNAGGRILPGLYARVRVPLERKAALLVPDTAVGNDQQGSYVLIVNEAKTVQRRGVKTGRPSGDMRVIAEGLDGNEWVIVKGLLKARPGSRVTPERENMSSRSPSPRSSGEAEVKP